MGIYTTLSLTHASAVQYVQEHGQCFVEYCGVCGVVCGGCGVAVHLDTSSVLCPGFISSQQPGLMESIACVQVALTPPISPLVIYSHWTSVTIFAARGLHATVLAQLGAGPLLRDWPANPLFFSFFDGLFTPRTSPPVGEAPLSDGVQCCSGCTHASWITDRSRVLDGSHTAWMHRTRWGGAASLQPYDTDCAHLVQAPCCHVLPSTLLLLLDAGLPVFFPFT